MGSHRGISEIVASMILLVIVSVMGVMLYNFSLENMNSQQNNLLIDVKLREEITQERFEIITVSHIDGYVWIYFVNYGQIDVKITDCYLKHLDGSITRAPYIVLSEYLSLNDGNKLKTSDYTYIKIPYEANVISYKIVSTIGVSSEFEYIA
jgi:hypothetical protein